MINHQVDGCQCPLPAWNCGFKSFLCHACHLLNTAAVFGYPKIARGHTRADCTDAFWRLQRLPANFQDLVHSAIFGFLMAGSAWFASKKTDILHRAKTQHSWMTTVSPATSILLWFMLDWMCTQHNWLYLNASHTCCHSYLARCVLCHLHVEISKQHENQGRC